MAPEVPMLDTVHPGSLYARGPELKADGTRVCRIELHRTLRGHPLAHRLGRKAEPVREARGVEYKARRDRFEEGAAGGRVAAMVAGDQYRAGETIGTLRRQRIFCCGFDVAGQ